MEQVAKSILQEDQEGCFLCGSHQWLEEHHIFGGANRHLSEKYGLKALLCHWCHNEPPNGVHHNHETRLHLQQMAQQRAMLHYRWSVDDFILIFGKNYL